MLLTEEFSSAGGGSYFEQCQRRGWLRSQDRLSRCPSCQVGLLSAGNQEEDVTAADARVVFSVNSGTRCLAETLLLDDFGVHATLSEANLCPMVRRHLCRVCDAFLCDVSTENRAILGSWCGTDT